MWALGKLETGRLRASLGKRGEETLYLLVHHIDSLPL